MTAGSSDCQRPVALSSNHD